MERHVYTNLSRDSLMSQSSIQRLFKSYLAKYPIVPIRSRDKVHLLIDGSYFSNGLCLILYYDYDIKYVQLYRETNQEKYKEIKEDLDNLKKLGVDVYSVTCDGHKAILKAIKKAYPEAIIQRCTVHVKRQCRNYLSNSPLTIQGQELLKISKKITQIKTQEESAKWLIEFHQWYLINESYINEKTYQIESKRYWFKHRGIHSACTLIIKAIPNLFCYLDDPQIPSTTNLIENYFSHIKEKLLPHRGLRFEAKKNFIKWYLYFKNENK